MSNNKSFVNANSASGPPMQSREINSVYVQEFIPLDKFGWPHQSKPAYSWMISSIACASGSFYAHLMNNSGSNKLLEVTGVYIIPRVDAALVPTTGGRLNFFRTNSSLLTAGSLWSYMVQSPDAAGGNLNPFDTANPSLLTNSWLSGRVLSNSPFRTEFLWASYFTGAASASQAGNYGNQFVNALPIDKQGDAMKWTFRPNEGLAIQNHPLSVGSGTLGLLITFNVSSLVT